MALIVGWLLRDEMYLTPEEGTGYGLGIVGTGAMCLLLLYSVRKRLRFMRGAAPIRYWFHTHMVLGILGPVAILFHTGFQLGSLNSNVALLCVLVVSASGVLGRFIYPKIHHGLSERRSSLRDLRGAVRSRRADLDEAIRAVPGIGDAIGTFESYALSQRKGFVRSLSRLLVLGSRARATRRAFLRALDRSPSMDAAGSDGRRRRSRLAADLDEYLAATRRVAELATWERLFSLWHAFHLPLCFILFGAAAVHVVAVHMY